MGKCAILCNLRVISRFSHLFFSLLLILTTFHTPLSANGVGELCDLIGSTQIDGNDTVITCIDFATHDGDTLSVPGSITAISAKGLALCPLIDVDVINTDIMYVLDQSQSMPTKTVAMYTDTDDTIYAYNGPKGYKGDSTKHIDILWGTGTKTVPLFIDVYLNNSNKQRPRYAGDPYGQSAIALHKTLDYQHKISPKSTAGFTGLHDSAAHSVEPRILTKENLKNLKDSIFIDDYFAATKFYPSLLEAKRYLLDTNICKNEKQMIIFISDGAPTDKNETDHNGNNVKKYLQLLHEEHDSAKGIMPPIYGIFLGKDGTSNYKKLEELSDTTGGEFFIVPPDEPDSLVGILKSIIEKTFEAPPLEITITNETIIPNQTSIVDNSKLIQQVDGSWLMELDSTLEVLPGYNDFRVEINKTTKDGSKQTLYHTFTLFADEDAIDTLFDEKCYDMASLQCENSNFIITDTLTEKDTTCNLYLDIYKYHALKRFPLTLRSLMTGDEERIIFAIDDTVSSTSTERNILRKSFLFHSNDTISKNSFNGVLETVAIDTIIARWKNPRNSKDTLTDTILVRGEEIAFKPFEAIIYDNNENGSADSLVLTFNRDVPTLFPVSHFYWNSKNSSNYKSSADNAVLEENRITYSFSQNEFLQNKTGIPTQLPLSHLPQVIYKKNQKYKLDTLPVLIKDNIGPVPVKATLKCSHPTKGESDTLQVTVSEKLMKNTNNEAFDTFIRIVAKKDISSDEFSMYAKSQSLQLASAHTYTLSADSLTYSFVIDKNHAIGRGARLFLDTLSSLSDREDNRASRLSVPIENSSSLFFTTEDTKSTLDSLFPSQDSLIWAHFYTSSISEKVDSLNLLITTEDGDNENVKLIETAAQSGMYMALVPTAFNANRINDNDTVEATFFDLFTDDTCIVSAQVQWDNVTYKDSLTFLFKGLPYIEESKLYTKNVQDLITNILSEKDTLPTIFLDVYELTLLDSYTVSINTAVHKDVEQLQLYLGDSINSTDTLRLIMAKAIAHAVSDITVPTPQNGIIETASTDTIYLSWINPNDPTDKAFDTLYVSGVSKKVSAQSASIFDNNEDGSADCIEITFDTLIPIKFELAKAFWNMVDPINERVPHSLAITGTSSIKYDFSNNPFMQDLTATTPESDKKPLALFKKGQKYPLANDTVNLIDKIGTVPIRANLHASSPLSSAPDTLKIILSEENTIALPITAIVSVSRITEFDAQPFTMYEKSIPHSNIEAFSLQLAGKEITEILSKAEKEMYVNKWICLDTTILRDSQNNRPGRKAVPINYRGRLYFTLPHDRAARYYFNTPEENLIQGHIHTLSLTDSIDTLTVNLISDDGEEETLRLIESDSRSGYYTQILPISYSDKVQKNNQTLEGLFESIYKNDTTIIRTSVTTTGLEQISTVALTYTGLSKLYVTNWEQIKSKELTESDTLFYVNINTDKNSALPSYPVSIVTAEHGDRETITLTTTLDMSPLETDPLRTLLSRHISFISSDITRPVIQNGRVETSSADTIFLSYVDQTNPMKNLYDTIVVTGTPITFEPTGATILDTNENGIADLLKVEYNHPIPEPFHYKALYWNSTNTLPITAIQTLQTEGNRDHLTWNEQSTIATGIDPLTAQNEQPRIQLMEPDFLKFTSLEATLSDGIGPVPVTAKLLCSHKRSLLPDTLLISSSENIFSTGVSTVSPARACRPEDVNDPLIPISGYENAQEILSTTPVQLLHNDSTLLLTPTKDNPLLLKGGYIFLNRESNYTDKAQNTVARKRIPLKRYEKLYFSLPNNPDSAITFAEWPNQGQLLATLPVESLNDMLVESLPITLTLPTGDQEELILTETTISSGIFTATFTFQFTSAPISNNGVVEAVYNDPDQNGSDTLIASSTTLDNISSVTILPLTYNAPPRITVAKYHPSGFDETTADTLYLTTNVPVLWPQSANLITEQILDYWDGLSSSDNITVSEMLKETLTGTVNTAYILVPREYALTPNLDSIRFTAGAESIITVEGISPVVTNYIPIEYGTTPPIEVAAVPNPCIPGISLIPELFKSYIPNVPQYGTGFRVRSRMKLSTATYTILDAVNNTILEDIPLFIDEPMNTLYGAWSGKSARKKSVGDGAYFVIFSITDIYGQHYSETLLVGAKEPYIPRYTFPWDH